MARFDRRRRHVACCVRGRARSLWSESKLTSPRPEVDTYEEKRFVRSCFKHADLFLDLGGVDALRTGRPFDPYCHRVHERRRDNAESVQRLPLVAAIVASLFSPKRRSPPKGDWPPSEM